MAESKSSEAPKGGSGKVEAEVKGSDGRQAALSAALAKLKEVHGISETVEQLQDWKVYPNTKVVVVLSDYRKFSFTWSELGLKRVSELPEDVRLV